VSGLSTLTRPHQIVEMPESWASRRARWSFNWFPAYRGTGARVEYISADWTEVRVRLPLSWRTRNYVGTIFGGSLYGAIDPMYMLMFMKLLGPEFVVWDKAASIRFLKPGRTTLRATFLVDAATLESVRSEVMQVGRLDRDFEVALVDDAGIPHATALKTIYFRWKGFTSAPRGG
jgi:acyl-coenzyme A thioesterase PaaI-like protein